MSPVPEPITIHEWWERAGGGSKPFLIVGKGPSFAHYDSDRTEDFHRVGLNHVVLQAQFDTVSLPDIENIADCQDVLEANTRFVLVPWHPHVGLQPSERTLVDFYADYPVLERLAS